MSLHNYIAKNVLSENKERLKVLLTEFDPVSGVGSLVDRVEFEITAGNVVRIPVSMLEVPWIYFALKTGSLYQFARKVCRNNKYPFTQDVFDEIHTNFINERLDHDFEYWSFIAVKIQDKKTGDMIPFKLNLPQRKLVKSFEKQRVSGKPIRVVVCKARQWGGSTCTQIYFSWIQIRRKTGWNSVIIADVENQARNITGMFTKLAKSYPIELNDNKELLISPFERSPKTREIKGRNNLIDISSTESPESTRGFDYALCHLSEVGSWRGTLLKTPEDMVQNIRGGVKKGAYSMIVMESTAKGVGNFFHREWLAAKNGDSGYEAFFMPWHSFADYLEYLDDNELEAIIKTFTDDDWKRWEQGATIQGIVWYRNYMRLENMDKWRMESEFPGDDIEAFQSTGTPVFHRKFVNMLRQGCFDPIAKGGLYAESMMGSKAILKNIRFEESPQGRLWIWDYPDKSINVKNRYIVAVDIGGTTDEADWSTINVLDRYWTIDGGKLTRVATWRGHIDQDLLAWISAQIAFWYNEALLIVESNSLRKDEKATEGDHFLTVLDKIAEVYGNVYTRTSPERVREGVPAIYGWHTNKQTKPLAISTMRALVRDDRYEERDVRVCDEMDTFQVMDNGTMGAVSGSHDDLIVPTSIGAHVSETEMPPPVEYKVMSKAEKDAKRARKAVGESSF